jgi:hypothetical protein
LNGWIALSFLGRKDALSVLRIGAKWFMLVRVDME